MPGKVIVAVLVLLVAALPSTVAAHPGLFAGTAYALRAAEIKVKPKLTVQPAVVARGRSAKLTVSGFLPKTVLAIVVTHEGAGPDIDLPDMLRTSKHGELTTRLTVPAKAVRGLYKVTVFDPFNDDMSATATSRSSEPGRVSSRGARIRTGDL